MMLQMNTEITYLEVCGYFFERRNFWLYIC
jgi:hypothetical protein